MFRFTKTILVNKYGKSIWISYQLFLCAIYSIFTDIEIVLAVDNIKVE